MLRRGAQHRQGQGAVCQGAQSPSRGSVICGHGGGPGELCGEQVVGSLQSRQAGAPLLRVWVRAHQAGLGEVGGEGLGGEQSGAAEACWAHNPEVDGSKPSSATAFSCRLLSQAFVPLRPFLSGQAAVEQQTYHSPQLCPGYAGLAALLAMLTLSRLHTPPTHAEHVHGQPASEPMESSASSSSQGGSNGPCRRRRRQRCFW